MAQTWLAPLGALGRGRRLATRLRGRRRGSRRPALWPQPIGATRAHRVTVAAKEDPDPAVAVPPTLSRQRGHARTPLRSAYVTCSRRADTLTIFATISLHHVDLEVALGHEFLQARVLLLELLQPPKIVGLERPEPLLPRVDRLISGLVPLGGLRPRTSGPMA